jgi:hypothetical protein
VRDESDVLLQQAVGKCHGGEKAGTVLGSEACTSYICGTAQLSTKHLPLKIAEISN